ncbi:glycosyltransferase family 2 protein [Thiohalocapsa sp. ML1]|jgi:glycosyltransferase involved in cell wall biosynthesis|uniref:glycosyltransferase family 2 protein n=1 Tax=Thiohalocapsa sp. ML1 TaxID=1431688 RepID=UPI000731F89B|nr:glycosyltransferase family 2 protein [Thiohalocapsa sp. ML1]
MKLSIIIPAHNEAETIGPLVAELAGRFPDAELFVVDDASSDETAAVAAAAGATVLSNPYRLGNGASVKRGARAATGDLYVFLDADGQHRPEHITRLLAPLEDGYAMVVGARQPASQSSRLRWFGNSFYNKAASLLSGHPVLDLTSGFRAVRADLFRRFLYLLPNGFSYPTTITMAFLRSGFPVKFVYVDVSRSRGKSHIRPVRDGVRFLLIIFKMVTLYSPMKLFFPVSIAFLLTAAFYYSYTYITVNRFTNMGAALLIASVIVFMMGLVSEQLTALMYRDTDKD